MDMSEQGGGAIFSLIIVAILAGPFYVGFLIYGYHNRKYLVLDALPKWLFVLSFPVALLLTYMVKYVGTNQVNTPSDAGTNLYNWSGACLIAGILAAIFIAIRTHDARRSGFKKKPKR